MKQWHIRENLITKFASFSAKSSKINTSPKRLQVTSVADVIFLVDSAGLDVSSSKAHDRMI